MKNTCGILQVSFDHGTADGVTPVDAFHALSDPLRLRIVELLVESKGELCLCDFSESLNEADYKLSRHLKVLKEAGLIHAQRDGKWIYHSLVTGTPAHKHLFLFLANAPKPSESAKDIGRYQKMMKLRAGDKCRRPGSATTNLKIAEG